MLPKATIPDKMNVLRLVLKSVLNLVASMYHILQRMYYRSKGPVYCPRAETGAFCVARGVAEAERERAVNHWP